MPWLTFVAASVPERLRTRTVPGLWCGCIITEPVTGLCLWRGSWTSMTPTRGVSADDPISSLCSFASTGVSTGTPCTPSMPGAVHGSTYKQYTDLCAAIPYTTLFTYQATIILLFFHCKIASKTLLLLKYVYTNTKTTPHERTNFLGSALSLSENCDSSGLGVCNTPHPCYRPVQLSQCFHKSILPPPQYDFLCILILLSFYNSKPIQIH